MTTFLAALVAFGLAAGALALGARRGARAVGRTCAAGREAGCVGCEDSDVREPMRRRGSRADRRTTTC
jgi:hypothetical protein